MKKKLLLIIALIVNLYTVFAQQLNATEEKYLADLITKKVNAERKRLGVHSLSRNKTLTKAAKLHATYMATNREVTHYQKNEELKTPHKRVLKFSKDFNVTGENVLNTRSIKPPFTNKKLSFIANLMFKAWKKSPEHYENIISNQFSYADFGFSYDKLKKQIYAAHVFGNKTYKVPNQLSEYAFGVIDDKECVDCKSLSTYSNVIANMGNNLSIEGNEIIFRYHNKAYFNTLFTEALDGLAIDLVTKDQIKCGTENKLDSSPIYDGVILPPVYRDELKAKNKAKGDYRVVISLGIIPEHLKNKELSANLIIIKNQNKCAYKVPVSIPHNRYNLTPITPNLLIPNTKLKSEGIAFVKELYFDFASSKTTALNITPINTDKEKIHSIDIKSYTSVDGSYKNNAYLFKKRADFIKNHLINNLKLHQTNINTEAKENWELFDFQLEIYGLEGAIKKSKKEKRKLANTDLKNTWSLQFGQQRKSKAIIFEKGSWKTSDKNHAYYNLIDALISDNSNLANKALVALYNQEETINYVLSQDFILERLILKKDLVQNTSALIIKNINSYEIDSIIYYINYWLKRYHELTPKTQENLLNLYTITAKQLLMYWDIDNERLARVLHPDKVEKLFDKYKNSKTSSSLYLNYQMAIIEYFGQINDYPKIEHSFNFIKDYFSKHSLTINDDINLALFFNNWSMYNLTLNLLFKSYLDDRLNEQATFILAKTLIAYPEGQNKILLKTIQQEAIKMNKKKWCEWMKKDFQNLRQGYIKNLYCSTCSTIN